MDFLWTSDRKLPVHVIREDVEEHPELLADEKAIKESFHNIKEETLDVTHILEDDIKSSRKDK